MKKLPLFLLALSLILGCFAVDASAVSLSARSAVLIDASDGRVLFDKNGSARLPMASTTKIMTAVAVLGSCDPDETVTVPSCAAGIEGSSVYLVTGERLTVRDLLFALLLSSANDAAAALACHVSGSVESFAALMNETAARLGLADTRFSNPHGLDAEGHYTTARDLARLTAYALTLPLFREAVSTRRAEIPGPDGSVRLLVNHNKLLGSYPGCIGVKTGYTKKDGRCLVSAAERNGLTLIAVTLSDPDDWRDHAALLDFGFENYRSVTLCEKGEAVCSLPVTGTGRSVGLIASETVTVTVPVSSDGAVRRVIECERFFWDTPSPGSVCGRLRFTLRDGGRVTVPLTATPPI